MSESRASPPVTVIVARLVRRGRALEFERLMAGMQGAAATFPGHMGGFLIPPDHPDQGCYRMLFAFDTDAHLQAWTESRERQCWHRRIADVTHGEATMRVLSGLETWVALPAARTKSPPPRWKVAIVAWMGIFPLGLMTSHAIVPALAPWIHPLLVSMISTGLVTVAMTWVVMPALVPLFGNWLYPESPETPVTAQRSSENA